jgi:hypothetical protein
MQYARLSCLFFPAGKDEIWNAVCNETIPFGEMGRKKE